MTANATNHQSLDTATDSGHYPPYQPPIQSTFENNTDAGKPTYNPWPTPDVLPYSTLSPLARLLPPCSQSVNETPKDWRSVFLFFFLLFFLLVSLAFTFSVLIDFFFFMVNLVDRIVAACCGVSFAAAKIRCHCRPLVEELLGRSAIRGTFGNCGFFAHKRRLEVSCRGRRFFRFRDRPTITTSLETKRLGRRPNETIHLRASPKNLPISRRQSAKLCLFSRTDSKFTTVDHRRACPQFGTGFLKVLSRTRRPFYFFSP